MKGQRTFVVVVLVSTLAISGCALLGFGGFDQEKWNEGVDLSRTAFIREMVTSGETRITPHFDDYTPGAYHVDKVDLIDGVRQLRDSLTRYVAAVMVGGPDGPLWAYQVVTVLDSTAPDGPIRVNCLVFAHARIRYKSTCVMDRARYSMLVDEFLAEVPWRCADTVYDHDGNTSVAFFRFENPECLRVLDRISPYEEERPDWVHRLDELYDSLVCSSYAEETYNH